jgi:hypothetical protein
VSGQAITRLGRYKAVAVLGMAITTTGLFLLSVMDTSTTYATVIRNMMVMGVGLGLVMPVFTLAVQNAVDPRQVGVATSSIQFLRTMGGSLGAAIFGAVLANRFGPALAAAMPAEAARRLPAAVVAGLSSPQALMNPALTARLTAGTDPAALAPIIGAVRQALAGSLHQVFLAGTLVLAASLAVTFLMVDVPLRASNRLPTTPAPGEKVAVEPIGIGG